MKRVLSALVLIPLVAVLVLFAPPLVFALFLGLLMSLSLLEFYRLGNKTGADCHQVLGVLVGISLVLTLWYGWPQPLEVLLVGVLVSGLFSLFSEAGLEKLALGWMITVFGWVFVAFPLALVYSLRFENLGQTGPKLVFFVLIIQWVQDTAAYYVGNCKLAPKFSPKKTLEGALAGLVAAGTVGVVFFYRVFDDSHLGQILILSVALGIAGQLSDLAESLFKRCADAKDSSGLIPGHGGILDRVDGLLFASPLLWVVLHHWSI